MRAALQQPGHSSNTHSSNSSVLLKSHTPFFGRETQKPTPFFNPSNTVQAKCTDCEEREMQKSNGQAQGNILLNQTGHSPNLRTSLVVQGSVCPTAISALIATAANTASGWVSSTIGWFDRFRTQLLNRARILGNSTNRYSTISLGARIYRKILMLRRHFNFRTNINLTPISSRTRLNIQQFRQIFNRTRPIRVAYNQVFIPSYSCQSNCPQASSGRATSDVLGSAVAGGGHFVIYSNCFRAQPAQTQAGVVLHEAFHSSFNSFNHDTYSFQSAYPGRGAMTNAESYANFASIVSTQSTYRIIAVPPQYITGRTSPTTPTTNPPTTPPTNSP